MNIKNYTIHSFLSNCRYEDGYFFNGKDVARILSTWSEPISLYNSFVNVRGYGIFIHCSPDLYIKVNKKYIMIYFLINQ